MMSESNEYVTREDFDQTVVEIYNTTDGISETIHTLHDTETPSLSAWPVVFEASSQVHEGIKKITIANPIYDEETGEIKDGIVVIEYNDGATYDFGDMSSLNISSIASLNVDEQHRLHAYNFANRPLLNPTTPSTEPGQVLAIDEDGNTYWRTIADLDNRLTEIENSIQQILASISIQNTAS